MDTLEVTNELLDVEVNMNTNTTTAISATNTIIRTRTMTSKMILLAFLFLDSFVVSFSAEPTWLGIFCKMNGMMHLIMENATNRQSRTSTK